MRISDWSSDVCSSDLRIGGLDLGQPRRPCGEVERIRVGLVRDRQAAADVDGVDRTDAVGETCQLGVDLAPVRRRDDATAQVRMDAADACIELPGLAYEGIERRQRSSEEHTSELTSLM